MVHLPGDELIPDANMVFDRSRELAATPEEIWPWLVQLGKHRAGWYLPSTIERFLPARRRAARALDPRWLALRVGERIPDYGGPNAQLEVASIAVAQALVYRSERRSASFSWALILEPVAASRTQVHLRLRCRLKSVGWRRRAIAWSGDQFDCITGELMLRGLEERVTPPR
jgi:hypothetical protein